MSGSEFPPEGPPEGAPGGGEDEYRSVVFDESFVRAARIQEFSARERLDGAARAVRIRHVLPRGLVRQAAALILLIVLSFAFAIYMGVRHPYRAAAPGPGERPRVTLIPLIPSGPVAAVQAAAPFAGVPAASYDRGIAGLRLPRAVDRIGGFDEGEVREAYATAQEYLSDSGLDGQTISGGDIRRVRDLLDPGQLDAFDAALTSPSADGLYGATGWMVRFDPAARITVGGDIRVRGTLAAVESGDSMLEVSADHTFVYALRGPGSVAGAVSLFTVRRQMTFRFDHRDLRDHHIELVEARVDAGPLPCAAPVDGFRPVLAAGPRRGRPPGRTRTTTRDRPTCCARRSSPRRRRA